MYRLFLLLAAALALSPIGSAQAQGLAVNPSAAASDVRNPSSFNPAAAASDIRNPSATNPAAAASEIRQPGLASPSAPAATARPGTRRVVGPPERRPRNARARRAGEVSARKIPSRPGAVPARSSAAERKASEIMGTVCRGC
jgi:hypothetical protein